MTLLVGCDESVDNSDTSSEAAVCTTVGTTAWWNQPIPDQTGRFHVELDATPSATNIDGTIGLSAGATSKWTSLAAVIRFNPQGRIDARAGSEYRADREIRYDANHSYHLRFDVDVKTHTYSAWVSMGGEPGAWNYWQIGANYPFRTEQASVTHLNNVAVFVNPQTGPGVLTICGVGSSNDATTADGCTVNTAGQGFVSSNVLPSSTVQHVSLHARPGAANIDAVVGVTVNGATSYNDFAASIRFYTNGLVEARDGDVYRADASVPYRADENFDIHFIIDMPSKTYSAYIASNYDPLNRVVLARNYRFRPQQASATSLGSVVSVVASSTGRVDVCTPTGGPNYKLFSARGGTWNVQALASGALLSDGTTTVRVDGNNVPTGSVGVGGHVAADSAGNVYVARIANGSLTVRSYTPAFALRWTATRAVTDPDVGDIIINSRGHLALALGSRNGNGFSPTRVVRYDSFGRYLSTTNLFAGATAIDMAVNHFAVATPISGGVQVEIWGYETNQLQRTRQFIGDIDITRIAIAPDDTVVLGGHLLSSESTASTFDGCAISPFSGTEVYWNAYVTSLRSDLSVRFCDLLTSETEGISTTGTKIAVSYLTWTQLHYVDLVVYDVAGNVVQSSSEDAFVGGFGFPGSVTLGSAGQLYLNESASLAGPSDGHVPLLVTVKL